MTYKTFIMRCNTPPYGVGGFLLNRLPSGGEKPIILASRTMSQVEKKYSQMLFSCLSASSSEEASFSRLVSALQKDYLTTYLRTTLNNTHEHTVRPTRVKKIMSDHNKVWKVRGSLKHSH